VKNQRQKLLKAEGTGVNFNDLLEMNAAPYPIYPISASSRQHIQKKSVVRNSSPEILA